MTPGMTISLKGKVYRVESAVKVTVTKGVPFIKSKLKDLLTDELIEKNFKLDQEVDEVNLQERTLEYLYPEGKGYYFLDINELEGIVIPSNVIGDRINYLKEGIQITAMFYGETVFSIELPQYLELMILKTEAHESKIAVSSASKVGVLETGAKIDVPLFIEAGDIVKVDTHGSEFVQRI